MQDEELEKKYRTEGKIRPSCSLENEIKVVLCESSTFSLEIWKVCVLLDVRKRRSAKETRRPIIFCMEK